MKKAIGMAVAIVMVLTMITGCSEASFEEENDITVITREDGSGTRGAFVELFGIEQKDASGKKFDRTILAAITNDKTGILLTTVSSDVNAIGYISLGSLNDTVKALEIDGAAPSIESIRNGDYKVVRPFNMAAREDLSEVGKDFVKFVLSSDGQKIVEEQGYIRSTDNGEYVGNKAKGKIKISGSSSVTPVVEKLKEVYERVNQNATVEINMTDSTSGMSAAADGTSDIGLASREIKEAELAQGLKPITIANDGIAVIINNRNPLKGLTTEDVMSIYTGQSIKWEDLKGATWSDLEQ